MPISEHDIACEIPQVVEDNYFYRLISLRNLAFKGWGHDSQLWGLLNSLVNAVAECEQSEFIIFNAIERTFQKTTRYDDALIIRYKNKAGETVLEINNRHI